MEIADMLRGKAPSSARFASLKPDENTPVEG